MNSNSTPRSGVNDPKVGAVLDHLGLKRTRANFDHFDKYIDWEAVDEDIRRPKKDAVCHVLDGSGKVILRKGKPVEVIEEVYIDNYEEILRARSKEFVRWW